MLNTELDFFNSNLSEWSKLHSGKYALIKGVSLIGFYKTQQEALADGYKNFKNTAFLVKQVSLLQEPLNFSVNYNLV